MQIIGEKINGTLQEVKVAIRERNASFIRDLARRQVEAGAALVDVNAGTLPAEEPDALSWLVKTVQDEVEVPLCLDSANPQALAMAIQENQANTDDQLDQRRTIPTRRHSAAGGEAWLLGHCPRHG